MKSNKIKQLTQKKFLDPLCNYKLSQKGGNPIDYAKKTATSAAFNLKSHSSHGKLATTYTILIMLFPT